MDKNYELLTDAIFFGVATIRKNYARMIERNKRYPSGYLANFDSILTRLKKIKRADEMPPTIGFFGGQSRGKSSLINTLAGENILPVDAKCGMTSVVIKLKHDSSVSQYRLEIISKDKENKTSSDNEYNSEDIKEQLRYYGSHRGNEDEDVEKITVTHNFDQSAILRDGGVLVDTPGAEYAFDNVITEEDIETGKSNGNVGDVQVLNKQNTDDVEKAISILEDTQIVLFTERADKIGEKNGKVFFNEYLNSLYPYTVINCKDTLKNTPEEQKLTSDDERELRKQKRAIRDIATKYGVNINRAICVSCWEARKNRPKSNIPKLEEIILTELQNLHPEKGLLFCVQKLLEIFSRISEDYKTVRKEMSLQARKVSSRWKSEFPNPKDVFSAGKSQFKCCLDLLNKYDFFQAKELSRLLQSLYDQYGNN